MNSGATGCRTEVSDKLRFARTREVRGDPYWNPVLAAAERAKQLIEATAQTALGELNIEVDKNAALPALISTVQKALKLDAGSAPDGPDGSKAVKKILSGSVNIAVGVAELRNQGFGSGHDQASAPLGPGVRHARLTVNAAVT
ncbi:abortive infection family protein [Streptomyces sp. NPDC059037]|uniref:abortive infection family protein n=1 Tax=Streptomyces sp. NPDC059037 TaxID=3346710 RepID=UPI0036B2422E